MVDFDSPEFKDVVERAAEAGNKEQAKMMAKPELTKDWEEDLKLYLTSAGDRRRTTHFIKDLLQKQREDLIEEIEKLKRPPAIRPGMSKEEFKNDAIADGSWNDAIEEVLDVMS